MIRSSSLMASFVSVVFFVCFSNLDLSSSAKDNGLFPNLSLLGTAPVKYVNCQVTSLLHSVPFSMRVLTQMKLGALTAA